MPLRGIGLLADEGRFLNIPPPPPLSAPIGLPNDDGFELDGDDISWLEALIGELGESKQCGPDE